MSGLNPATAGVRSLPERSAAVDYSPHLDSAGSGPWPQAPWFVIEGIDGCGKTSTALAVSEMMRDIPLVNCSHKEVGAGDETAAAKMRELATLLWPAGDTTFVRSLPSRYRVHLHAAWYSLYSECVLKRRLLAGQVLLLDSWIYKFLAHLIVFGYDRDFLEVVFSHVPPPTLVILLDAAPEAVWERKREFGPIELGLYMDYEVLGRESFIDYQERIRAELLHMTVRYGWHRVAVSANESVDGVAARVAHRLRTALAPARSEPRSGLTQVERTA